MKSLFLSLFVLVSLPAFAGIEVDGAHPLLQVSAKDYRWLANLPVAGNLASELAVSGVSSDSLCLQNVCQSTDEIECLVSRRVLVGVTACAAKALQSHMLVDLRFIGGSKAGRGLIGLDRGERKLSLGWVEDNQVVELCTGDYAGSCDLVFRGGKLVDIRIP